MVEPRYTPHIQPKHKIKCYGCGVVVERTFKKVRAICRTCRIKQDGERARKYYEKKKAAKSSLKS